jgi:hypothetical protein
MANHLTPRAPRRRIRLRLNTGQGASLTVNVGPGGFCTALMRVLPVGDRVQGMIHFEGREESFQGRVVWTRPGNPRLSVMGTMGVRFDTIAADFAPSLATCEGDRGMASGTAAVTAESRT